MINRELVVELMSLDVHKLVDILTESGYTDTEICTADFTGLSDSGHFVYSITYYDDLEDEDELSSGSVFVSYDTHRGMIVAEF